MLRFAHDDAPTAMCVMPDVSQYGFSWSETFPAHHDGDYIASGRLVLQIPGRTWPHRPESCPGGMNDTELLLDGKLLVCTGCGLEQS